MIIVDAEKTDKIQLILADGTENSLTNGGSLYVNASGDGLDSNGTLTISGGYTVVCGPTQGDTATLDYESSGVITGGTFIGTGAAGMAQTFSDSEQGVITVSAGSCAVGTAITLTDGKGNTIISYSPGVSFSVVILSSPEIIKGQPYTITGAPPAEALKPHNDTQVHRIGRCTCVFFYHAL